MKRTMRYFVVAALAGGMALLSMSCGGGGGGGGAATVDLGLVSAWYGTNGDGWNDYVSNDGPTIFEASDIASARTGTGGYSTVIHGGEMRAVIVSGQSSCTGLSAADALDALDWSCYEGTDPVVMISTGLKDGRYLSDLLDFDLLQWKENTVTVRKDGSVYGSSPSSAWWSNPIKAIPGTGLLGSVGGVYAVASTLDDELTISVDKVALVTGPDAVIRGSSQGFNVVNSVARSFLWIEADMMDAPGDTFSNFILTLQNMEFSVLRGVSATGPGNAAGIRLLQSRNNRLEDLVARGNGTYGLYLDNSPYNRIRNVETADNVFGGLYFSYSSSCNVSNVVSTNAHDTYHGIGLYDCDGCTFTDIASFNNGRYGLYIGGTSTDNVFVGLTFANNGTEVLGDGISVNDGNNVFINLSIANNHYGINNQNLADGNTYMNVAAVNNHRGIMLNSTTEGLFANISAATNDYGIMMFGTTYNTFTGELLVGDYLNAPCWVSLAGTDSGVDGTTCANNGNSDAYLTTGLSVVGSFVGKVTSDDAQNISDGNGAAQYNSITDWTSFENAFRGWGRDGAAFASTTNRGYADSTETCRIWDWSLDSLDTVILDALPAPGASDTLTHTWSDMSATVFLRNALEIAADEMGNDNGLCEADEDCVYTPNIGSYQGHGALVYHSTVSMAGGDVDLYEYSVNGN